MNRIIRREGLSWQRQLIESVCGKVSCACHKDDVIEYNFELFYKCIKDMGKLTNELQKQHDMLVLLYKEGKSIKEIASLYTLSPTTTKMYINKGLECLSKYWWESPIMPISIAELNKAVIMNTGSIEFLDSLKQVGICTLNSCYNGCREVYTDAFKCVPYLDAESYGKFYNYLDAHRF